MWKVAYPVPVFKSGEKWCVLSPKSLKSEFLHVFFSFSSLNFTIYKIALLKDIHVLQVFSDLHLPLPKHLMRRNSLMQYFWITVKHLILFHLTAYYGTCMALV